MIGPHDARVRGLVCTVRDLEDQGRFDAAAQTWRALADPEQALRCQVLHLDQAGLSEKAAELLESKQRYAAASERWNRAGDTRASTRCGALRLEKKGQIEEAMALWASVGEHVHEARCRAIVHLRREELEAAAREYERAGNADTAAAVRELIARRRERTGRAIEPSVPRLPQHEARGAPPENARDVIGAVLTAVRDRPGTTCEDIAGLTRLTTRTVKPLLSALVAQGRLVKTGRTRGTRYHLA